MASGASDKETRGWELFSYKLKCDMRVDLKCFMGPMGCRRRARDGRYCRQELARHRLIGEAAWTAWICCLDMCKIHLCGGLLSIGNSRS